MISAMSHFRREARKNSYRRRVMESEEDNLLRRAADRRVRPRPASPRRAAKVGKDRGVAPTASQLVGELGEG